MGCLRWNRNVSLTLDVLTGSPGRAKESSRAAELVTAVAVLP